MSPDQTMLGPVGSFVLGVVLPSVLVILLVDVLLRQERRMVFWAKRARLEAALDAGVGTLPGPPLPEPAKKEDPWWTSGFKTFADRVFMPCMIFQFVPDLIWKQPYNILGWGMVGLGLYVFWTTKGHRWQRALEWSSILGLFLWLHFHPDVAHFLLAATLLVVLSVMGGSIVLYYAKEGARMPESSGLPASAAALKRRYVWTRICLWLALVTWIVVYVVMFVLPAMPPDARAAFGR
jgi:hypothetical protein